MTALSKTGVRRLAEAEAKIERGFKTFQEVGDALLRIRDERLYRADFDTFEDYCQTRWHMTRRRANQLVEAAQLGTIVPVANEAQARELTGLEPDDAIEVYEAAEAEGEVTAKSLAAARERRFPKAPSGSDQSAPLADAAGSDDDQRSASGAPDAETAASPTPKVAPVDPALKMHAHLSDRRKAVADWLAFDRHHEVIDNMTPEQRADYRSFVHSVWQHASETLDYLDAPARLKAVQ